MLRLLDVQNPIRTPLLFVSVFALFGTAISGLRDTQTGPQSIAPSPSMISAGSSTTLEIVLNQPSPTNTVVALSCSSGSLSVPSTVTIPAGETVGYANATSSSTEPTEVPVISASANGYEAQCQIGVASIANKKS